MNISLSELLLKLRLNLNFFLKISVNTFNLGLNFGNFFKVSFKTFNKVAEEIVDKLYKIE